MLPNNAPDARKANRKRIFKRILLVCVILAAVGLALLAGLNLYVVSSAEPYILTEEQAAELSDVDCIIVLGALVYSDGRCPTYCVIGWKWAPLCLRRAFPTVF